MTKRHLLLALAVLSRIAESQQPATAPLITPRLTRVLHAEAAWIGVPDLSPNNRWMVYSAGTDTGAQLWIVPASGGKPSQLTSGAFVDYGPIWFPAGDRIVFVSNRPATQPNDMYLMTIAIDIATGVATGAPTQLTSERVGGFGAPSPDGRRVAYPSLTEDSTSRVMIIAADGQGASIGRAIALHRASWARTGPEFLWSSDGRWIYHVLRGQTGSHVFTRVAAANGAKETVGELPTQIAHPDATGRFVLLRTPSGLEHNHEIATIEGRTIARFFAPQGMWIYRFSANGRSLIAQQSDPSGTSLWLLDIGDLLTVAR